MIRNKLAELLAERQIKISRVANDVPNLSRNTITSTAQNSGKMIQLETINSLCQYLDISPSDFFEYLPFDVTFNLEITKADVYSDDDSASNIKVPNGSINFDLYISVKSYNSKSFTFGYVGQNINDAYWNDENNNLEFKLTKDDDNDFKKVWDQKITPGFQSVIWDNIKKDFVKKINDTVAIAITGKPATKGFVEQINKKDIKLIADFETDTPTFNDDFPSFDNDAFDWPF